MRFKTWPVAAVGLAGLLLIVVFSVITASQRAQQIYTQLDHLNMHHRAVEAKLRALRGDVHLSGIFVRDYLLDTSRERAPEYRAQLAEFRDRNRQTLDDLNNTARRRADNETRIRGLQLKLEDYWQAFEPLFDWTIVEKINQSAGFIRREVIPRREEVLRIAEEIEQLNNDNLAAQRAEVTRQQTSFRTELGTLLGRSLFFGLLLAVPAVIRLRILERRSDEQRIRAQEAEGQMRELSQQLVAAQEAERKSLSRELHDHVGQMLTVLRMELGRIERTWPDVQRVSGALAECRQIVDDVVNIVRDLALGLRPSMLDDFGLGPALEWLVRDTSRRFNLPIELHGSGSFELLDDKHKTSIYRIVQEALTNCVKHAKATRIGVALHADTDHVHVSVRDDGVGLDAKRVSHGFGLRGIEERVRELGGAVSMVSGVNEGTTLSVRLPVSVGPRVERAAS